MQRVEGPQTPYEVYCYHCRVTFPVETRRCIHCGERLGPGREAPSVPMPPASAGRPRTVGRTGLPTLRTGGVPEGAAATRLPGIPPTGAPEDDDEEPALTMRRFGVPLVWALVAISAILSNLCEGRG